MDKFKYNKVKLACFFSAVILLQPACKTIYRAKKSDMEKVQTNKADKIKLIVLEPGHFHAALVQKEMYAGVDTAVQVFAPEGPELDAYLGLIKKYNTRKEHPTNWDQQVYTGKDYLDKVFREETGNTIVPGNPVIPGDSVVRDKIIVLAGKNGNKTAYIKRAVDAGINVLSDKPMVINPEDFELLKETFEKTGAVLLYDIMTSRYEITNMLEKELAAQKKIFGDLEQGTEENPAVVKQSTHHFYKTVSGAPLVRPAWYFDVDQEGRGLVDVTTHLADLIQWECFPEKLLDYRKDVQVFSAREWPTLLTASQFQMVTKCDSFPDFLKKEVKDGILEVYANGEMNYRLKGIHARVSVTWNFQAPEGASDTFYSLMRGTKANLVIRQGREQQYKPTLYIEPNIGLQNFAAVLQEEFQKIEKKYPGLSLKPHEKGWEIIIPEKYNLDHEQQFAQVTKKFLEYLRARKMPEWEIGYMKTKYFTTTRALKIATKKN